MCSYAANADTTGLWTVDGLLMLVSLDCTKLKALTAKRHPWVLPGRIALSIPMSRTLASSTALSEVYFW